MDYNKLIAEHSETIAAMQAECMDDISRFAEACRTAIASGRTIYRWEMAVAPAIASILPPNWSAGFRRNGRRWRQWQ